MTATYFESTVKYEKVNENGKAKKVTELYLIDAMSFSETEERSCRQLSEIVQGDYLIQSLKRSKITEYIESNDENDDRLYKATVKITDSDNFGKEKESSIHYLVAAANINRALDNVEKGEDQRSSGFRYGTTDFASTRMHTGSRLCFKNIELAKYATEQFKELYREYLLIL